MKGHIDLDSAVPIVLYLQHRWHMSELESMKMVYKYYEIKTNGKELYNLTG